MWSQCQEQRHWLSSEMAPRLAASCNGHSVTPSDTLPAELSQWPGWGRVSLSFLVVPVIVFSVHAEPPDPTWPTEMGEERVVALFFGVLCVRSQLAVLGPVC